MDEEACGCQWEECPDCGGAGYFDWETLQFEDPFWYQPGDTELCTNCAGQRGWLIHKTWCPLASVPTA